MSWPRRFGAGPAGVVGTPRPGTLAPLGFPTGFLPELGRRFSAEGFRRRHGTRKRGVALLLEVADVSRDITTAEYRLQGFSPQERHRRHPTRRSLGPPHRLLRSGNK